MKKSYWANNNYPQHTYLKKKIFHFSYKLNNIETFLLFSIDCVMLRNTLLVGQNVSRTKTYLCKIETCLSHNFD